MQDKKLVSIVICVLILVTLHLVDHVFRGDLRLPLSLASLPFIVVSFVIYGVLGVGWFLYTKHRVGPRFWTVLSVLGLGLGWLSHFSPYTDQNVKTIQDAYQSGFAGWLAVICLVGLMVLLVVGGVYAGSLWAREMRERRERQDLGSPSKMKNYPR